MHHEPMHPAKEDGKIYAEWYENGNTAPRSRSFQVPESLKPRLVMVPRK